MVSFGSEGKGAIAAAIAEEYSIHVRVGAANAGHTVYTMRKGTPNPGYPYPHMDKHVLQQLPCAAYTNPNAELVLGPGALISEEILAEEIALNEEWRLRYEHPVLRLVIDCRAHIVTPEHISREQRTDLAERIGSTSTIAREGIGAATAARVMREAECVTAEKAGSKLHELAGRHTALAIIDAVSFLHDEAIRQDILLEGTQGTGLSLTTGAPPYTTSRNTTAAGLLADCGIAPGMLDRSIVVMRTFPIRVAGNSGPFYAGSRETCFEEIGVEPERTTVTKLVRRVATFSTEQARDAVRLNAAPHTEVALTFMDYVCPKLFGQSDLTGMDEQEIAAMNSYLQQIASAAAPVTIIGTGPHSLVRARWSAL